MKLKEELQKQQDTQMNYYCQFFDWLYSNIINSELNDDEIQDMEEVKASSQISKQSISRFTLDTANNVSYYPELQEA
jgi:hypothetical protein